MRRIYKLTILLAPLFLFSQLAFSQNTISNGSLTSCSGTFTDSNANGANNYGDNESFTYTICSDMTGGNTHVSLAFDPLDLVAGDLLCFFDGDNTSAPSLGCSDVITNTETFIIQATAVNPTGCITITFNSDGVGNATGWNADISCVPQCQTTLAAIASSIPPISPADTGYIDICPGDIITLNGIGEYPQNNFIYAQSDLTSSFEWDFGDGTGGFGPNITHQYNNPGGYVIQLTVTDIQGCTSTNFLSQRVRVSGPPEFNLTGDLSQDVCVNDTLIIFTAVNDTLADISINPGAGSFQAGGVVADSVCVPDGTGETYDSPLELGAFSPGQTLNDINDLIGICVVMEHSFLGDLEIVITCPNGQSVILHEFSNFSGGGYNLGTPIDDGSDPCASVANQGIGDTYCWTPGATNGTWLQSAGLANSNGGTLPPGDYSSFQNLTGLLGCSLNGVWNISITDSWGSDDGTIFSWELLLNEDIFPNLETYDLSIVNAEWLNNSSVLINSPDSLVASPLNPGNINYTFEVTDNFGCIYDTLININVLPQTDPSCYSCSGNLQDIADVTICDDGETTQLSTQLENVALTTTTFESAPNDDFSFATAPPGNPLTSTINVSGLPYNFIDAASIESICLNIDHPANLDVNITLVSPNGTSVLLSEGGSGAFGANYLTGTCFTPSATDPISGATPPYTGDFSPNGNLSNFIGSQANGNWTLQVEDDFVTFGPGTLLDWSMTFNLNLGNTLIWNWSPINGLSCTDCPDPVASPTTTTNYTVSATDPFGCIYNDMVTVSVIDCNIPCTLTASLTNSSDATCAGIDDGTATIVAAGQVGMVNYVLDGTVTQIDNGTFTGLSAGAHQVILTDENNCTFTVDFNIATPIAMSIILSPNPVTCNGVADGSITSTTSGGDGNYTYAWDSSQTSADLNNILGGDYTVTATDGNGCSASATTSVFEPTAITATSVTTEVSCLGGNDGTISVTALGGTGTLSFEWSIMPDPGTAFVSNLSAGTYTVTITDASMCSITTSETVIEPATAVQITSISQTASSCFGENNGEATVVATGGTGAFTYDWSTTANGTDIETGLSPGTYTVTVSDVNGCSITSTVDITENSELILDMTRTNVSCFGGLDGTASPIISGGTAPYTYSWNDAASQTDSTATGLSLGVYTVLITDQVGCTVTDSIEIIEPTEIQQFDVIQDVSCFGGNDGFVGTFQSGGVFPYQYDWNTGVSASSNTSNIRNYEMDFGNGCITYNSFSTSNFLDTICYYAVNGTDTMEAFLIVSVIPSDNCAGDNTDTDGDGLCDTIDPDPTDACSPNAPDMNNNGTCDFQEPTVIQTSFVEMPISSSSITCLTLPSTFSPLTTEYFFCNNSDGNLLINVLADTYTLTITDSRGCSIVRELTINEPPLLESTTSQTDVSCFGGNDGQAIVIATGGTPPYAYLWSDTQTNDQASNLLAGDYTVTITDDNGCTATNMVTISEPTAAVSITSITQTSIGCDGSASGVAEVIATGGTGGFSYSWSSSGNTAIANGLTAGTHTVIVTDANGCQASDMINIIEYAPMSASAVATDVSCFGGFDGTASVTLISGGAGTGNLGEYSYAWSSSPVDNATVNTLSFGDHTVTITDIEGCTTTTTVTINQPNELQVNIQSGNLSCSGTPDGFATAQVTGGTAPYNYQWDAAAGNATVDNVSGLAPGTYNITVTDNLGCTATSNTVINPVLPVDIEFNVTDNPCFGDAVGEIEINAEGGTPPFTYNWSNGTSTTSTMISGLPAGIYVVTVVDANNCETSAAANVNEPAALTTDIDTEDVTCHGDRDGSIVLTGQGGVDPYQYSIDDGAFNGSGFQGGMFPGYYTVNIQDQNGCLTTVDSVLIGEPLAVEVDVFPSSSSITLPLGDSITLGAGVTNAVGTISYQWDALYDDSTIIFCPNCQYPLIYTLENDRYTVIVTDENGCTAQEDVEIVVPRYRPIFVPSAFTPNGDGVNDFLMVHGKTGTQILEFRVYDRWGELIFSAEDYDVNDESAENVWNGEFKGKAMNTNTFVWYLKVKHIDERIEAFEGNTTLFR